MPAVVSYKVGVTRSHKRGPTRWLTLKPDAASDGVQLVTLFFYESGPTKLGYLNRQSGVLTVNLPAADFQSMYGILNTEKPVFVHFRLDPEEHAVLSVDLSTSEEPIGEGPVDQSP